MTLDEFDALRDGDRVRLFSRWLNAWVAGVVSTLGARGPLPDDYDEIEVAWDDGKVMRVKRHEVRVFREYYEPIQVVRLP